MSLSRIFLIISFAISYSMNAQTVSRTLSHGTLQIELKLIPVDIPEENWDSDYSIQLTRAIKRSNLPESIAITFGGNRYRKVQVDQEWGWEGKSMEFFDLKSEKGWFCKEHPLLKACVPFSPAFPGEPDELEEIDEPVIELLDETREILGFSCRKARWSTDEEGWEVWYAEQLALKDEMEFLWGLPGIPGLIMEMTERPERGQVSKRHYQIKLLYDSPPSPTEFEIPGDYRPFDNSTQARKTVLELVQQSIADKDQKISKVEGPWRIKDFSDELYLKVEIKDGTPVLIKELGEGVAKKMPVSVGGDQLLQVNGLEFTLYQVSEDGKQLERVGKSPFQFQKAKSRKLRKAGIDFE